MADVSLQYPAALKAPSMSRHPAQLRAHGLNMYMAGSSPSITSVSESCTSVWD
jgi:hypothetical protein